MIGIIYNIKSELYIGLHPIHGFFKTDSIKALDSSVLWISNIKKNNLKYNHIKEELFFNIKFKNILYYYNANHLDAPEQFQIIQNFFNNIISIFKEEYRFFNFETKELNKLNNFSDILFKSKISNLVNSDSLEEIKHSFNKEVKFKELSSKEYFLSYYSKDNFIKELLDLTIPFGTYQHFPIEKYSNLRNPYKIMETMRIEQSVLFKCKVLEINDNIKEIYEEKLPEGWFTDFELINLKDKIDLEVTEVIVFQEKRRLKEIMRTLFKTKYNNFAFEIFCKNVVLSLKNNNIDTVNIWIDSFEKSFYLNKVVELKENNISVGYFSGSEIVLSISSPNDIITLENSGLIYPIKLIQYILNN